LLLLEVNVAAPLQPPVAPVRKEERLAFLMTPWVDKTIAVVAVIPFAWLTYIRLQSFGFDVPRVALLLQGLLFIGTMVIRKTPVRVSTNPWLWLLTFVETYWVILIFAVMRRGQRIAPYWVSGSLATLGAVLMIWARLSLGRSIGLVPALRSLVTHGPYRYVRHPIYLAGSLIFVANVLSAYSARNLAILVLGIFWFALKSVVEESFLRSDPGYADYMQRVRWRWLPGIA
jgi:protein-S-isoprenylcysteine O-methyltransferase Ste14